MTRTAVVMLGHSHLVAVSEALARRPTDPAVANPLDYYVHDVWAANTQYANSNASGGVTFNPEVLAAIDRVMPPADHRRYVTSFGGNGHIVLALSRHPRPFDFVLPERPNLSLEAGAEIVPFAYIKKVLMAQMRSYIWQLIAFRQAIGRRCYCLETPPPCGDDEYTRTHLGNYIPDPDKIVGRDLRWKMWRLHSCLLREACDAHDIEFVAVPGMVSDAEGFLNPRAHGPDATHGNTWYGEVLLGHIDGLLGGRYSTWTKFTDT